MPDFTMLASDEIKISEDIINSFLKENNNDINTCDESGNSILHYAVEFEQKNLIQALLCRTDINFNLKNANESTFLDLCKDYNIFNDFIEYAINTNNQTALNRFLNKITNHPPFFSWRSNLTMLKKLLPYAQNIKDLFDRLIFKTPQIEQIFYFEAIKANDIELLNRLTAITNKNKYKFLLYAAYTGALTVLENLLNNDSISLDSKCYNVKIAEKPTISFFVPKGKIISPLKHGDTFPLKYGLLVFAAKGGKIEIIEWLLKHNYITSEMIHENKMFLFQLAAKYEQITLSNWLLENSYISNDAIKKKSLYFAYYALSKKSYNFIDWLIEKNFISIDIFSEAEKTYLAVTKGEVSFLKKKFPEPSSNFHQRYALLAIIFSGNIVFLEQLIQEKFVDLKNTILPHKERIIVDTILAGQNKFLEWLLEKNHITIQDLQNAKGEIISAIVKTKIRSINRQISVQAVCQLMQHYQEFATDFIKPILNSLTQPHYLNLLVDIIQNINFNAYETGKVFFNDIKTKSDNPFILYLIYRTEVQDFIHQKKYQEALELNKELLIKYFSEKFIDRTVIYMEIIELLKKINFQDYKTGELFFKNFEEELGPLKLLTMYLTYEAKAEHFAHHKKHQELLALHKNVLLHLLNFQEESLIKTTNIKVENIYFQIASLIISYEEIDLDSEPLALFENIEPSIRLVIQAYQFVVDFEKNKELKQQFDGILSNQPFGTETTNCIWTPENYQLLLNYYLATNPRNLKTIKSIADDMYIEIIAQLKNENENLKSENAQLKNQLKSNKTLNWSPQFKYSNNSPTEDNLEVQTNFPSSEKNDAPISNKFT